MTPLPGDPAFAVDVVIPCYNAASFLRAAIDSVMDQGLPGVRIVLVDDGSTDDSAAIASAYGPQVSTHWQPNAGIAAARNAGIERSQAPWLAFLDADDLWTEDSLKARFQAFAEAPETDLVFGRLEQFHSPELDAAARARLPIEVTPSDARFAGTLLARRESFLRVGAFNTTLKVGEMIDWIARAEAAGLRTRQVDRVVMRRRVHGDNTTLRQAVDRTAYLRALKAALDQRRRPRAA